MRESWTDTDDKTIRDDIVSIAKEKTGLANFKSAGVPRGFLEVLAAGVFFIYKTAINPVYANATLDGAAGIFLSFWGLLLGAARKRNSRAEGNFTGRSCGGGSVPEGARIVAEGTELRYKASKKQRSPPARISKYRSLPSLPETRTGRFTSAFSRYS
jgi:hypothetical protein